MRKKLEEVNICVITDRKIAGSDLGEAVRQALLGGAEMIQFRDKQMGDRKFYDLGRRLKKEAQKSGALFLINDRVDQALALEADGVHIGPGDLPLSVTREVMGPEKIIGYSVKRVADALWAYKEGADYLGVGPIYPTITKDAGPALGTEALQRIREAVDLPILAIGGINEDNVQAPILSGADGVAVIRAIMGAEDKKTAVERLRKVIILAKRLKLPKIPRGDEDGIA
jgi:thiamine-phosphate pyrophosphorylase